MIRITIWAIQSVSCSWLIWGGVSSHIWVALVRLSMLLLPAGLHQLHFGTNLTWQENMAADLGISRFQQWPQPGMQIFGSFPYCRGGSIGWPSDISAVPSSGKWASYCGCCTSMTSPSYQALLQVLQVSMSQIRPSIIFLEGHDRGPALSDHTVICLLCLFLVFKCLGLSV